MNKRIPALVLSLVAVALAAACGDTGGQPTATVPQGASTPSAPAKPVRVTIALGYIPNVQFAPYYVALEKGYYRDEGLDVTFKHGIVPDLLKLLGAGDEGVNFAAASGDEIIPARVQGIPVKYIMTWYRQYPVAAVAEDVPGKALSSPADLRGRTVGVPGPFGANYVGFKALLKAGGLTEEDVKVESIGFTQVESLLTKQVDTAMVYAANEPVQLRSSGMKVSVLMVSDYVDLAANGLATNDKTLEEDPELAARVVRATAKGIQDTFDDPKGALEIALLQLANAGQVNREIQLEVLNETIKLMRPRAGDKAASQPLGWTDRDVWNTTQDFLFDAKLIPEKGDVDGMFTNDFIEEVSR